MGGIWMSLLSINIFFLSVWWEIIQGAFSARLDMGLFKKDVGEAMRFFFVYLYAWMQRHWFTNSFSHSLTKYNESFWRCFYIEASRSVCKLFHLNISEKKNVHLQIIFVRCVRFGLIELNRICITSCRTMYFWNVLLKCKFEWMMKCWLSHKATNISIYCSMANIIPICSNNIVMSSNKSPISDAISTRTSNFLNKYLFS